MHWTNKTGINLMIFILLFVENYLKYYMPHDSYDFCLKDQSSTLLIFIICLIVRNSTC